ITGNVFVVVAIAVEKNLRNVANYLIASLAVADLLVAVLVMPIAAVNDVTHKWYLGSIVCDLWTSLDVICCTASILHLVAISMDRYWVVTQIDYVCHRPARRILIMIALSWTVAIVISTPPLFGWKHPSSDPNHTGTCLISQDVSFMVFSTLGAFYLPLILMMVIYYKVFRAAKSRIRKQTFRRNEKKNSKVVIKNVHAKVLDTDSMTKKNEGQDNDPNFSIAVDKKNKNNKMNKNVNNDSLNETNDENTSSSSHSHRNVNLNLTPEQKAKEKLEQKRERKAARTLAIVTGTFIFCWLPFFILATVKPFCSDITCNIPNQVIGVIGWLGYVNSLLNPVIYTVFNPDFRTAFKKLLFRRCFHCSNLS
ncbi:hypothetical protein HELRODRAFT_69628, partial [Helobdella robusta]|uniref:G-protein coupled receptors family 1 profile domain-containing protein n=1 Tax=Helobdella robusta TaxID=6412 RepID=T1FZX5_HELRO